MDITRLIEDDHQEQRRLFAILEQIDDKDAESLSAVWSRLAALLDSHAEAEERLFYPELLRLGRGADTKPTSTAETEDAIKDHNDIRDAVAKVHGSWEAPNGVKRSPPPTTPTAITWPRRSGRAWPTSGVTPRSTCATSLACVSPPLKPATSPALSLWTRTRRPTSPSTCPLRLPLRRSRPPLPRLRPTRRHDLYALNVDSA
jgi:hypothetical protein